MEVTRKLASIRSIVNIEPIDGADNIVCATVDGWKLVTQKSNNFQIGDLVIYFEIDSFLPVTEKFEFLRKSSYRKMGDEEGFRIKTIKLRGQVSQGLILPLTEFDITNPEEGLDLTETLRVKKWDPPLPTQLAGTAKGNFPSFLVKTDQERVQNIYKNLQYINDEFEVTLKLDGSSVTVYYNNGEYGVCSRNLDLKETEGNTFWDTVRRIKLIESLQALGKNIAIQGELMGPGVQGNRENLKTHSIFVFDIIDIDNQRYLTPEQRYDMIAELNCGLLEQVPFIDWISLDKFTSVDDYLNYADRESMVHPIAEGVVFKSRNNPRISFKAINNKFLLKEKD